MFYLGLLPGHECTYSCLLVFCDLVLVAWASSSRISALFFSPPSARTPLLYLTCWFPVDILGEVKVSSVCFCLCHAAVFRDEHEGSNSYPQTQPHTQTLEL